MCRIAGVFNTNLPIGASQALVKEMCRLQKNGGPDDEGIYTNPANGLVFGHRRLSIIDLSQGGHQPMPYLNERYYITYNGELYNYHEIRNELKSHGCLFNSLSDTEVVIAAYAFWGVAAFSKFNGMFAFAIWDNETREIILVRDISGIKPLYYANTKEGLAFASEVKALKSIPYLQEKNEQWPVFLMAYGHLPEPITTLKNVLPLEKGSFLRYNTNTGKLVIEHFAQFNFIEKIDNRKEAIEGIKDSLESAVKRHLISDAPIGVFLSGGLDSSIIAKLADKHQSRLNTISLYFDDSNYSEKKYQDLLQQQLSCSHHQHLLKQEAFHEYLPDIIGDMDLPCCDGINTWFISKYAKESGLKAVLSGIGGDELYGGYPSFDRINAALVLKKLPGTLLRAGRFSDSKKLRRLAYLSIPSPVGLYLFLRGQFIPSEIARYLNADETEIWKVLEEQPVLRDISYLTPKNQVSWLETNMYLQNQLLRDADVMSMAHGVEIRVPFLDTAFMQLTMKIRSEVKYQGKLGKQLLIDSFKDILPEPIWNRPKMGFSFPFREWFGNSEYAQINKGKDISAFHSRLVKDNLHWSQFFTILLLQQHRDA